LLKKRWDTDKYNKNQPRADYFIIHPETVYEIQESFATGNPDRQSYPAGVVNKGNGQFAERFAVHCGNIPGKHKGKVWNKEQKSESDIISSII